MTIVIKHEVDLIREIPGIVHPDLTFMVIPEETGFSAVCSTLSIFAQGNTIEELIENIDEAVVVHLTS